MVRPEYMRLKLSDIPDHIIKLYKLDKLVTTDGYVYVLIQKECTVSHRRASSLNNSLKKGWPSKATGKVPSHLVSGNTTGALSPSLYVLTTSVSNMLASNMHSTFYKLSTNTTEASQDWKGSHRRLPVLRDEAVDCTMLPALGSLATQQSAPTQNTMSKIHQFLDSPHDTPRRHDNLPCQQHDPRRPQRRILSIRNKARSRAGDIFSYQKAIRPRNNGAILTLAQIIKPVMSSAAEAELGALYINARRQYHNDTFSMNWDIHNLQLPYKLTTPQPLGGHQHHQPKAHQSNGHAFSLAPL
eukprot:CCRYP_005418-RA/>CCRYP_005418-RA protein AED:0.37 eAED:0.37 QI:0/0/0/1/1/1/2/0/298